MKKIMSPELTNLESLKKSCHKTDVFVQFLLFVQCFAALVIVAFIGLICISQDRITITSTADTQQLNIYISELLSGPFISIGLGSRIYSLGSAPLKNVAFVALSYTLIYTICMAAIFFIIHKILQQITSDYTPFSIRNLGYLKIIGYLLLYMSVGHELLKALAMAIVGNKTFIFIGSTSEMTSFFLILFLAAVIFSFARIFSYGCYLQTEYDETL